MLVKTRAIVLHSFRYGERKQIVDVYAEELGRLSFIAPSAAGQRGRLRQVPLQPLTIVEMECDIRQRQRLQRWKELRLASPFLSIPFQPDKLSIALFIAEFLGHALRGEQPDKALFVYIENSLRWLDGCQSHYANFHLVFLMRLSRFLGFYPNLESSGRFFDLRESVFTDLQPLHPDFLAPSEAQKIGLLMRMDYPTMHLFRMSREERNRCVDVVLRYYRLHLPDFPALRSLPVLQELFKL